MCYLTQCPPLHGFVQTVNISPCFKLYTTFRCRGELRSPAGEQCSPLHTAVQNTAFGFKSLHSAETAELSLRRPDCQKSILYKQDPSVNLFGLTPCHCTAKFYVYITPSVALRAPAPPKGAPRDNGQPQILASPFRGGGPFQTKLALCRNGGRV